MKKIFILGLISFLIPSALYAAAIGGALTQGKGKFSVGLDGEYIFERDMKREGFSAVAPWFAGTDFTWDNTVKVEKLYRGTVKLSYGLFKYLDVYARIGESGYNSNVQIANGVIRLAGVFVSSFAGEATMKGKNGLVWAVGVKGAYPVPKLQGWLVGLDAQYLRQDNLYKGSGDMASPFLGGFQGLLRWTGKTTIQEWHVAPYLAKELAFGKIGTFTPYIGGRFPFFSLDDYIRQTEISQAVAPISASTMIQPRRYHSSADYGAFCGLDYNLGQHFGINLEGRFFDETAVSCAASYKF